jgi:hypothetical protein
MAGSLKHMTEIVHWISSRKMNWWTSVASHVCWGANSGWVLIKGMVSSLLVVPVNLWNYNVVSFLVAPGWN